LLEKYHAEIQVEGKTIHLNYHGYLTNDQVWDEDIAEFIAKEVGIDLNICYWEAIYFIRDDFNQYEVPPSRKVMPREIGHYLKSIKCT